MQRDGGRSHEELRSIRFECHYSKYAEGSVLSKFGDTHVLCNVTVDPNLPGWLRNKAKPHGWLTAEYAMLPRSTSERVRREQRWPKGRTQEISRLIGRSLRMGLNLELLGERQLIVDCDVLQADGGTRTAAVTGGWLAVSLALRRLIDEGELPQSVQRNQIAAISVGLLDGLPLLDLAYREDLTAEMDLNVVMTATGQIVEIQGTAEKDPVSRAKLDNLISLAASGIETLVEMQQQALDSA